MMQQVAKALLDTAIKRPEALSNLTIRLHTHISATQIQQLLEYRQAALVQMVAGEMRDAIAAAPSRAAAAEASATAFEERMDIAVQIGWAYIEQLAFKLFAAVRPA